MYVVAEGVDNWHGKVNTRRVQQQPATDPDTPSNLVIEFVGQPGRVSPPLPHRLACQRSAECEYHGQFCLMWAAPGMETFAGCWHWLSPMQERPHEMPQPEIAPVRGNV